MSRTLRTEGRHAKQANTPAPVVRFIVLDTDRYWLEALGTKEAVLCPTRESLDGVVQRTTRDSLWITRRPERTEELVEALARFLTKHQGSRQKFGDILMLRPPRKQLLPTLYGLFARVIGETPDFRKLPFEQLAEVLAYPLERRRDVFIGGVLDADVGVLTLVRGDLDRITVPLAMFRPSGRAQPDFAHFDLDDYGHTLQFGPYEATADVVLWELDPNYRKRSRLNERAQAKGFGASLRRLRKQRGLSQSNFPNVARKTISRIERGEVDKPHGTTLNRIAQALGVPPDDIESY